MRKKIICLSILFIYFGFAVMNSVEYDLEEPLKSNEKLVMVKLNEKYGFINSDDRKVVIPIIYDEIGEFRHNLIKIKLNRNWGIIDTNGKEVYPSICSDEDALPDLNTINCLKGFHSSDIYEDTNGRWGLSVDGKTIIPYIYRDMFRTICDEEWLIVAKPNTKWGYINLANQVVIPFTYDEAYQFSDGVAMVKQNGKWGYINRANKKVIPLKYDDASYFYKGYAYVKLDNKWGTIDKTGKRVVPFIYDEIVRYGDDGDYRSKGNLAKVRIGNKWGMIEADGKLFIKIEFDNLNYYSGWDDGPIYYSDGSEMHIYNVLAFATLNGVVGIIDIGRKFHSEDKWRKIDEQE